MYPLCAGWQSQRGAQPGRRGTQFDPLVIEALGRLVRDKRIPIRLPEQ